MKTITAKELRDNLEEIGKKVSQGQTMNVTYRHRLIFTLVPPVNNIKPHSQNAGLKALLSSPRIDSGLDPNKSIKELYHEMLDNDPKYKDYR